MKYLYIDAKNYESICEYLEEHDGVFANEQMEIAFDRLGGRTEQGILEAAKAYKEARCQLEACEREIARLKGYRDKEVKRMASLEALIRYGLGATGLIGIGNGEPGSVRLTKNPPSLPTEIDEAIIPDAFFKEIPATRKLMRVPLLKAVKEGVVTGIPLVTDKTRLDVK